MAAIFLAACILMKFITGAIAVSFLLCAYATYTTLRRHIVCVFVAACLLALAVLIIQWLSVDELNFLILSTISQGNAQISIAERVKSAIISLSGLWAHFPVMAISAPLIAWALLAPGSQQGLARLALYLTALALPLLPAPIQGQPFTYQLTGILAPVIFISGVGISRWAGAKASISVKIGMAGLCATALSLTLLLTLLSTHPTRTLLHENWLYLPAIIGFGLISATLITSKASNSSTLLASLTILLAAISCMTDNAWSEGHRRQIATIDNATEKLDGLIQQKLNASPESSLLYLTSTQGPISVPVRSACYFVYPTPLQRSGKSPALRAELEKLPLFKNLLSCAQNYDGPYVLWEPDWFPQETIDQLGLSTLLQNYQPVAQSGDLVLLERRASPTP